LALFNCWPDLKYFVLDWPFVWCN